MAEWLQIAVSKSSLTLWGPRLDRTATDHYRNTIVGTLAIDGWAVTFGIARRGLGGLRPRPVRSVPRCTKCNSPPINGQCTNFILFHVQCQITRKWYKIELYLAQAVIGWQEAIHDLSIYLSIYHDLSNGAIFNEWRITKLSKARTIRRWISRKRY